MWITDQEINPVEENANMLLLSATSAELCPWNPPIDAKTRLPWEEEVLSNNLTETRKLTSPNSRLAVWTTPSTTKSSSYCIYLEYFCQKRASAQMQNSLWQLGPLSSKFFFFVIQGICHDSICWCQQC